MEISVYGMCMFDFISLLTCHKHVKDSVGKERTGEAAMLEWQVLIILSLKLSW